MDFRMQHGADFVMAGSLSGQAARVDIGITTFHPVWPSDEVPESTGKRSTSDSPQSAGARRLHGCFTHALNVPCATRHDFG